MISMDFPPIPGGISAHVYELARALVQAGNRVSVVTRRKAGEPVESKRDGIDIYRVSLKYAAFVYGLQIRSFVKKLLVTVKPDLIHIHGMLPLEWYDIKEVPLVYTNHTSGYLKRIKKGGLRRMALLKNLLRKPQLFLAPSKELLEVPFDIPAKKQFISNGVDGSKYKKCENTRSRIRQQLGLAESAKLGIITRRLVDKNGVFYLAQATKLIADQSVVYLVIGDGPERERVEAEFKKHKGDRAIFLGNKEHDEIIDYYSGADFSILPSLMEATSISGLEAMAAGLPLVGTRVGGIPELIQDGVNGYLCEKGDFQDLAAKINLLLAGDMSTFGKQSRIMVEKKFDWSKIAAKTYDSYSTIIN